MTRADSLTFSSLSRPGIFLLLGALLLLLMGCGKEIIYPDSGEQGGQGAQGVQAGAGPPASAPLPPETPPAAETGQAGDLRGIRPYTVQGKTYEPMLNVDDYSEEGIASWYGKDFHGRQTASGERYDMYGMTAAHKVLPFGAMVMVTNLQNDKSVVVRVTDRGPFVANRIIDLTYSAARQLDMLDTGTAKVRLSTVGAVQGMDRGRLSGNFYVQVGAFSVEGNAAALVRELRGRGFSARSVYAPSIKFWRVQVGPYTDLARTEAQAQAFKDEFAHNFIVAD